MCYPSDAFLESLKSMKIEAKSKEELARIMLLVKREWQYANCGYFKQSADGESFSLSTAGWSGNEDIVSALESNFVFWALFWTQVRKGGHYVFCVHDGLCNCGRIESRDNIYL